MKLNPSFVSWSLGILLTTASLDASPETWDQPIQQISELVQGNPDQPRKNQAQIDTCLRTIKTALAADDLNQAISQLNNLRNLEPDAVKPILQLSEKLIETLVERSKRDIERKEKLYQKLADALLSAKHPADIDLWLERLNQEIQHDRKQARQVAPVQLWTPPAVPNSSYSKGYQNFNSQSQLFSMNTGSLLQLQSQANPALQIARYWQDYLQYKSINNHSSAYSSMNNIAQLVVNFTYIPRSKVLALQAGLPINTNQTQPLEDYNIESLKKRLGTQNEALTLSSQLRNVSSSKLSPEVNSLKEKLQVYSSACDYLSGGDLDDGYYYINRLTYHPLLGPLSRTTHMTYLRRHLKAPAHFTPNPEEDPAEWATRYVLKLSKDREWKKLQSAVAVMYEYFSRASGSGKAPIKEDAKAVNYLLAGINYENNQQYLRAIVAYRQAVGKLGYCMEVTNEAGKRLRKLQQAHPTEFAQSQSLGSHDGTSHSFTTSHLLIRKIVKQELGKQENEQK